MTHGCCGGDRPASVGAPLWTHGPERTTLLPNKCPRTKYREFYKNTRTPVTQKGNIQNSYHPSRSSWHAQQEDRSIRLPSRQDQQTKILDWLF